MEPETKAPTDLIEQKIKLEPVEADVQRPSKQSLPLTREQMRMSLQKVDDALGRKEYEIPLVQIWDEVSKTIDTNEHIKVNLEELQLMIQRQQNQYYMRMTEADKILEKILEASNGDLNIYRAEKERLVNEQSESAKRIQQMMLTAVKLASEYRQCALQKRYVVHIAKVLEFKTMILAIINQHISDPKVLCAIAEDIRKAVMPIFKSADEGEEE